MKGHDWGPVHLLSGADYLLLREIGISPVSPRHNRAYIGLSNWSGAALYLTIFFQRNIARDTDTDKVKNYSLTLNCNEKDGLNALLHLRLERSYFGYFRNMHLG